MDLANAAFWPGSPELAKSTRMAVYAVTGNLEKVGLSYRPET